MRIADLWSGFVSFPDQTGVDEQPSAVVFAVACLAVKQYRKGA